MATPEDIATALRYGPQTAQLVRRSAYLEDALRNMQESGGKDIRSPWELAAKLAATAILGHKANAAQDATLGAVRADQKDRIARMLVGLEDNPAPAPAAAPTPPPVSPAPPVGPVASAPLPPAQPPAAPANYRPPVDGRVTSAYGAPRPGGRTHNGVDLAVPSGTPVLAPADGEVIAIGSDPASGNFVRLRHADGSVSSFGHLTAAGVKVGDRVPAGATFATSGATGRATGPHVHYVHRDAQGRTMDPMSLGAAPQPPQVDVPPPPPPPNPMGPPDQPAMPYQVAAVGPTPAPPMPSAPGSSPPAAGNPVAAPPAAAGNPNPWQDRIDLIKRLAMSPRYEDQQQAEKLYADLMVERTKPVEWEPTTINGAPAFVNKRTREVTMAQVPQGARTQLLPAQQAGLTGAPNGAFVQSDPMGNLKEAPFGPPAGYEVGPGGRLQDRPGGPADVTRPQPPQQGYQYVGPNRMAVIPGSGADPTYGANLVAGEGKLRDDYEKQIAPYVVAREGYQKVVKAAGDMTQAGAIAMVFGVMKTLDPGSTVREGEAATVQNSGTIPETITNMYNKLLAGTSSLSPEQRAQFANTARLQFSVYQNTFDQASERYGQLARSYGYDPSRVVRQFPAIEPYRPPALPTGAGAYPEAVNRAHQNMVARGQYNPKAPLGSQSRPFLARTPQDLQALDTPANRGKFVILPDGSMGKVE